MHPLGKFPLGSHDTWQFWFYVAEMKRFFSVRLWASNSVQQAWAWYADLPDGKPANQDMIAYLDKCEYTYPSAGSTCASQASLDGASITFTECSSQTHSGVLSVSVSGSEVLLIKFTPRHTFFWQVPGQDDGVFHFPNLSAEVTFEGQTAHAFGYCKRYWGDYDGPWGYQFIPAGAADEKTFVWTADATFGDDEYNYFKIVGEDGQLVEANKTDTYHNNQRGFWRPLEGPKREVELKEVAKMEFFLRSGKQYSKLVERFGPVQLKKDGSVEFDGFGFNEICFGTVG